MNANTLTTTSTVDALIGAYRGHVLGRPLPAPVMVNFYTHAREIDVQPDGGGGLAGHLANLLVWAYTLTDVTAHWRHTIDGGLHVAVIGRTAGGARMRVYGGGEFADCHGLVNLAIGQKEGVSLDELYTLTALLREAQHEREAA